MPSTKSIEMNFCGLYLYNLLTTEEINLILKIYNIDLLKINDYENKILSLQETIKQINKSIKKYNFPKC